MSSISHWSSFCCPADSINQTMLNFVVKFKNGLRGSASPVLTATGFVNGKGQFSTPYRIGTPQPITKQFLTGDNLGDPYSCVKLGAYPSTGTGGFWANG